MIDIHEINSEFKGKKPSLYLTITNQNKQNNHDGHNRPQIKN